MLVAGGWRSWSTRAADANVQTGPNKAKGLPGGTKVVERISSKLTEEDRFQASERKVNAAKKEVKAAERKVEAAERKVEAAERKVEAAKQGYISAKQSGDDVLIECAHQGLLSAQSLLGSFRKALGNLAEANSSTGAIGESRYRVVFVFVPYLARESLA